MSSEPPYARFMIYVWAYEQGSNSKRKMGAAALAAAEGAGEGKEAETKPGEKVQDVLVPWVYQPKTAPGVEADKTVYHRYYHLFVEGELRQLIEAAAKEMGYGTEQQTGPWMRIRGEGYEADNWWVEGEVGLGICCLLYTSPSPRD